MIIKLSNINNKSLNKSIIKEKLENKLSSIKNNNKFFDNLRQDNSKIVFKSKIINKDKKMKTSIKLNRKINFKNNFKINTNYNQNNDSLKKFENIKKLSNDILKAYLKKNFTFIKKNNKKNINIIKGKINFNFKAKNSKNISRTFENIQKNKSVFYSTFKLKINAIKKYKNEFKKI